MSTRGWLRCTSKFLSWSDRAQMSSTRQQAPSCRLSLRGCHLLSPSPSRPGPSQDKNGDPVSGNVNVFLSISDPRLPDGLDSASGQFTFQDSEGDTRLLKTFGVVTLLAEDTNGNEVYLSGKATMTLNTDAMGLTVGESVSLWVIDGASGTWRKTVDMMTGSRRRRRRQASMGSTLTGQTAITSKCASR